VPIIITPKEQTASELVHQLFTMPQRGPERISQAVQALIEANPHLEGVTTIPAGTPIVVPHVPDLTPRAAPAAQGGTWDELRTRAQEALTYARSVVEEAARNSEEEAKASLDVLRSREFQNLAVASNVDVESLTKQVSAAAQDAQTQAKTDLAGLDALNRAVDELIKTLTPGD
jgi:hypothetical protein